MKENQSDVRLLMVALSCFYMQTKYNSVVCEETQIGEKSATVATRA